MANLASTDGHGGNNGGVLTADAKILSGTLSLYNNPIRGFWVVRDFARLAVVEGPERCQSHLFISQNAMRCPHKNSKPRPSIFVSRPLFFPLLAGNLTIYLPQTGKLLISCTHHHGKSCSSQVGRERRCNGTVRGQRDSPRHGRAGSSLGRFDNLDGSFQYRQFQEDAFK